MIKNYYLYILLLKSYEFIFIGVLPLCISMHHVPAWHLWGLEEGIRAGDTDGYELP